MDQPARAVVLGASLSGMLAARALSPHFDEVIVVERDRLDGGSRARKGLPQAHHVHVLLKRGERILEEFFPGIGRELTAAGSHSIDMAADTIWFHFGGLRTRFPSGITMHSQSRALLEAAVRRRVCARSNVILWDGRQAQGLALDGARKRLRGVWLRPIGSGPGERLDATLVVDATGKGTRTPHWLERLGMGRPRVTEVGVDVGYASRFYTRGDPAGDWKALLIYPRPLGSRLGVLLPVEGQRWLLTLVGWFGDHPPGDEAGFAEFVQSLPTPHIETAIRDQQPLTAPARYRFPADRRRHFEEMRNLPEGLAVLGDAFCTFNPIYGQGMTTGALGAKTLADCLAEAGGFQRGFTRSFHRRLSREIDVPWTLATAEDVRNPKASGKRGPLTKPLLWYTAQVHRACWRDPRVAKRFLEVMHMLKRPRALFAPQILARVVRVACRASPGESGGRQSSSIEAPT